MQIGKGLQQLQGQINLPCQYLVLGNRQKRFGVFQQFEREVGLFVEAIIQDADDVGVA